MTNKYRDRANGSLADAKALRHRWRMCERKTRYDTQQDAAGKGAMVYFCRYCKGFHRTQSLMNLGRARRRKTDGRPG